MSALPPEIVPWLHYAAPPLVGAFIGYLTNRVAIRMLFRPLKRWRLAGIRVPMTPGVIPAKRHELARNMGEVVGDHLLTSAEIGRGLEHRVFQEHLGRLIRDKVEAVMHQELGTLKSLVPLKFQVYFSLGSQALSYQLKQQVHRVLAADTLRTMLAEAVDQQLDRLLAAEVDSILGVAAREELYRQLKNGIDAALAEPAVEQWLEDFVRGRVYTILQQEKALADLLPPYLLELIVGTLERQVPRFLGQLAGIIGEEEIRQRIVREVCGAVQSFVNSMGSMAEMVRGFVRMDKVEEKVGSYLIDHHDEIVAWLTSVEVQERVVTILRTRSQSFFARPIVTMVRAEDEEQVNAFCDKTCEHVLRLLRGGTVTSATASLVATHLEEQLDAGSATVGEAVTRLGGKNILLNGRGWLQSEAGRLLKAEATRRGVGALVDHLLDELANRKIGRLANLLPGGVREDLANSLQLVASKMLASEVPGLVQSLNIRRIVTDRINALDLLKLEGLLLSIMADQFKYINLFGALLGFLIGCLNVLVLVGL